MTYYKQNQKIRDKKYEPKKGCKFFNKEQLIKIKQFIEENKAKKCNLKIIKEFANFLTKKQKEISNGGLEKILKKNLGMSFKTAVKKNNFTK